MGTPLREVVFSVPIELKTVRVSEVVRNKVIVVDLPAMSRP